MPSRNASNPTTSSSETAKAAKRGPSTSSLTPIRGGSTINPLRSSVAGGAPSPTGCASASRTARLNARNDVRTGDCAITPTSRNLQNPKPYDLTTSRLTISRPHDPTTSRDPNVPRLLEIVARVRPERRQRHRALDALYRREFLGDHFGDALVLQHLHDHHQVPLAGYGVDLLNTVDPGKSARGLRDTLRIGADQHYGCDHWLTGKGGTSSNQTPARRSRLSISSSMSRAMRTVRTSRPCPNRK